MKRMHNMVFLLLAFGLQAVAILGVIGRYERICRKGEVVRLPCRAYDPLDPFRGRYLRMTVRESFSSAELIYGGGGNAPYARFAPKASQEEGKTIHHIVEVAEKPSGEGLWMQSTQCLRTHGRYREDGEGERLTLELDFPDQFFLPEKYASRAEALLAEHPEDGVAVYRILGGQGVLVDVEVKGVSLLSRLKSP
ncbi:MAG: GDYXXLXY domain-containing protein [Oligosphaeraceae bacterium]